MGEINLYNNYANYDNLYLNTAQFINLGHLMVQLGVAKEEFTNLQSQLNEPPKISAEIEKQQEIKWIKENIMNEVKKARLNDKKNDSIVYLEPIEHKYIHKKTGIKFPSVTTIISSIESEFPAESIAEAITHQSIDRKNPRYVGMSKSDILEAWQKENDEANHYGSMVHEIVEDYLLANKWYTAKNDFEKAVILAYDELKVDEGMRMTPERILFSEEFNIAGMTDLLVDVNDELFDIGDWKTNKKFNFYSEYGTRLLPPFDYLEDCQYSVYSLQLSIYALLYEMETGKKCRHLWAAHFNKETLKFEKIPIIYLKHEAMKLLKMHKYKSQII